MSTLDPTTRNRSWSESDSGSEPSRSIDSLDDFGWMKVSELRSAIEALGGDHRLCAGRSELTEMLSTLQSKVREDDRCTSNKTEEQKSEIDKSGKALT